jgi:tetratricopeptide (TPR) repeat protein
MNRLTYIAFGIILLLLAGARSLSAQQVNPRVPPPPPPAEAPAAPAAAPAADPATAGAPIAPPSAPAPPIDLTIPPPPPSLYSEPDPPAAPSGPVFDPLHAQRSLDIGTFYLRKGSYDAAIDRFIEASNYQPTLAMPWKFLGEAYEKKHEYSKAAEAYNKYLRILPHALDAAKITKTISDLEEKSAQESPKKAERQ